MVRRKFHAPQILASLCAAGAIISTAACGGGARADKPQAPPPTLVSVIEVQPSDVPIYAEYPAQTFARDLVEIRGRVDGFIQKRLFEVGSDVRAGQVLYELDLRPYQADVAKADGDVSSRRPIWISPKTRSPCCRLRQILLRRKPISSNLSRTSRGWNRSSKTKRLLNRTWTMRVRH